MTEKLGLRVVIGGNEKDLDDIFLKISDYNTNQSDYQSGEAVVLTQNTGIKYIDDSGDSGVKRDLIERYIGYDSEGYESENYEADPKRIGASYLNKITDTNYNNLVNLFYQLGTKKLQSNEFKTYSIHNRNKKVDFYMKFLQDIDINVNANHNDNKISMKYKENELITITDKTVNIDLSQTHVFLKVIDNTNQTHPKLKFFIEGLARININQGSISYEFNKDTV